MLQGFLNTNLRIYENQYLQAKEGLLPGGVDLVLKRRRPMLRSTLYSTGIVIGRDCMWTQRLRVATSPCVSIEFDILSDRVD